MDPRWNLLFGIVTAIIVTSISAQRCSNSPKTADSTGISLDLLKRTLRLPNQTIATELQNVTMKVEMYDILCVDLSSNDVKMEWDAINQQSIFVDFGVYGVDLMCTLNFHYSWSFISGVAKATIEAAGNNIETTLLLSSPNIQQESIDKACLLDCEADIIISKLEFIGPNNSTGFIINMLNSMKDQFQATISDHLGDALCEALGTIETGLTAMIGSVAGQLNRKVSTNQTDPLMLEHNMVVPENTTLVNFLESSGSGVDWLVDVALVAAREYLVMKNNYGSLNAVQIIRKSIGSFDDQGAISLNVSSLNHNFVERPVKELETFGLSPQNFGLLSVNFDQGGKIVGLDRLKDLFPIKKIGQHTLELSFLLDDVTIELHGNMELLDNTDDVLADDLSTYVAENESIPNMDVDSSNTNETDTQILSVDSIHVERNISIEEAEISSFDSETDTNNTPVFRNTTRVRIKPLHFVLRLENVTVSVAIMAALNERTLGDIRMGTFLGANGDNFTCLSSSIHDLQVGGVQIRDFIVNKPSVIGLGHRHSIDKTVNALLDLGIASFRPEITAALSHMIGENLAETLIGLDFSDNISHQDCLFEIDDRSQGHYLDLRDLLLDPREALDYGGTGTSPYGTLIRNIKATLDESLFRIDPTTGQPFINEGLLSSLTEHQSGTKGRIRTKGKLYHFQGFLTVHDVNASLDLSLADLVIDNLNRFNGPLNVMDPLRDIASGSHTFLTIGNVQMPLNVSFTLNVLLEIKGDVFENEFSFSLKSSTFALLLDMAINISEADLFKFPIKDLNQINCVLGLFESPTRSEVGLKVSRYLKAFKVLDFDLWLKGLEIDVRCSNCSTPGIESIIDGVHLVFWSYFNGDTDVRVGSYVDDPPVTSAQRLVTAMQDPLKTHHDVIKRELDRLMLDSRRQCSSHAEHDPGYVPGPISLNFAPNLSFIKNQDAYIDKTSLGLLTVIIAIAILITAVVSLGLAVRFAAVRRQRAWLRNLSLERVAAIHKKQLELANEASNVDLFGTSIYSSTEVPTLARYGIPATLLVTVVLFLAGFFAETAMVNAKVSVNSVTVIDFVMYHSFARIVQRTWLSGGRIVSFVGVLFCALWPVVRQVASFCLFFTRTRSISTSKRWFALKSFDLIGKWSMFVVFMNLFSCAAFRITVMNSPDAVIPWKVDVTFLPTWGLYSTLLAQLLSHVNSRLLLHYHQKAIVVTRQQLGETKRTTIPGTTEITDGESEHFAPVRNRKLFHSHDALTAPSKARYAVFRTVEPTWLRVRSSTNISIVLVFSLFATLVAMGLFTALFHSEIHGMLTALREMNDVSMNSSSEHSFASILVGLANEARSHGEIKQYFGLFTLIVFTFVSVILVPVIMGFLLLVLWFFPMGRSSSRRLYEILNMLFSLQYLDVFVFSALMFAASIDDISYYMLYRYCNAIQSIIQAMANSGILSWEHARCFSVEGDVENGIIHLMIAVIIIYSLSAFVSEAYQQLYGDEKSIDTAGKDGNDSDGFNDTRTTWTESELFKVDLLPIQFTDKFRMCLRKENKSEIFRYVNVD